MRVGLEGLACDGENLWALDEKNKRICIIEKTESGRDLTDELAARRQGER